MRQDPILSNPGSIFIPVYFHPYFRLILMLNNKSQTRLKVCLIAASALFALAAAEPRNLQKDDQTSCVKCHSGAAGRAKEVVQIHFSSTHAKSGIGCHRCHGGDPEQADKTLAHAGEFTAKPDANATLIMCGKCHRQALAEFKTSRHLPESRGIPRLDCAECHGVHSIGNPPESFSLTQFCAGCHGLEYLPALPQSFQDLLIVTDELHQDLKRRSAKGSRLPVETDKERKALRRSTGEIVHRTDLAGGIEKIPQLLIQAEKLRQQIRGGQ